MAKTKVRTNTGTQVDECFWGRHYTGTPEGLVATGLFKLGWFSTDVKPGRRCFDEVVDGREIRITRRSKFIFDACWHFTEAEGAQNEEIKSQRKAIDNFNRAVACLPKSEQAFKAFFIRSVQAEAEVFLEFAGPQGKFRGGFAFAAHSLSAIEDAFDELIEAIHSASVVYSEADRQRGFSALRLTHCGEQLDPAACRFVDALKRLPAAEE